MKGSCLNALTVTGENNVLNQFWKEIFGNPVDALGLWHISEKTVFCFNALVPVPRKFEYKRAKERNKWYREHWGFPTYGGYEDGDYYVRWNDEHTELLIVFATPSVPPLAWVKNASNIFPELEFSICFEGSFPLYGQVSFSAGAVSAYNCASYETVKHWFKMFCSIEGFLFSSNEENNARAAQNWMITAIEDELTFQFVPFVSNTKNEEVSQ